MNPLSLFYTVRAHVEAYAGLLGQRFLSFIWVLALGALIWIYGYMVAFGDFKPLEPALHRIIAIAALVVLWVIYVIFSVYKGRKADKALIDDVAGDAAASDAEARAEVDLLRERLKDAMSLLRRVVKKRFGYVYELPWYLIIGAPGSGKTTSLTHSGLKFPLGEAAGAEPVRGVGGTRNCNWWFTEEAIFIDTAGRYTIQGDLGGADKAGWDGFLKMLRKHRPSQPLNGVMITLSVPDLLDRDPSERVEEIRRVRQRLAEMDEVLGARTPAYLMLTKADLLDGFVPFFNGLSRTDREQVWGVTFPLETSTDATKVPEQFGAEFDLLCGRVSTLLMERLQQEPDIETRGRMFHLPARFARLRAPVQEVLNELCAPSKLAPMPLVRGLYLASGTQDDAAAAKAARASGQRSYFMSRLFHEVILGEAALVANDRRLSGRSLLIRRVAVGAAMVAATAVFVGWTSAYIQGQSAVAHAQEQTAKYAALAKDIPIHDVADADFLRVLPALDTLAEATSEFGKPPLLGVSFGLDQSDKVEGSHRLAYGRALNALLLPRLMVYLQNRMQEKDLDAQHTFDALKLYGMLGGIGPMEADEAVAEAREIFDILYPGEGRRQVRESLTGHVRALVGRPMAAMNVDDALIADARRKVEAVTPGERAVHLLKSDPAALAVAAWTPLAALGTAGETAFVRRSGAPLREGVAGLYTRNGFMAVVLTRLPDISRSVAREGWVRGRTAEEAAPSDISRDALRLYFSAFERTWRDYLADLSIRQADTLPAMAEITRVLSSAPYPFTRLAGSVAEATDLVGLLQGPAAAATAVLPIEPGMVPDPYERLRAALAKREGSNDPAQIEALQPLLRTLYEQVSRGASSSAEVSAIFDVKGQLVAANQALIGEVRHLPPPVDHWVGQLTAGIDQMAVKTARTALDKVWQAEGARLCTAAIEGRYPFDRNAQREVAMDDFVRVFGPKGVFEIFFEERLAPFVDTSSNPWRWRGSFGAEGEASEALKQFGLARQIRQAFFTNGEWPSVSLTITPEALDETANAVILEIEGERVVYFHGPILTRTLIWPARQGSSLSRIMFQPGGWDKALARTGPWSALRLFDTAKTTPLSDDRFRARFEAAGHAASFTVQVGSIVNPFATGALSSFRCPTAL
ncbi:type VI secretion system membrane subunit TssM [Xanthobacteraceae bacterium A53D]